MTYQINDSFDSKLGLWDATAPWDATMYYDSSKSFLTTQEHVDIRTFRVINEFIARPQSSLEAVTGTTVWEGSNQLNMEQMVSNSIQEPWVLTGTGAGSLTTGAVAARGGWPGLQLTTTSGGGAYSVTLTSSIPSDNLNISAMNQIIALFPDHNSFDTTNSKIQFTSDPNGVFGNGFDSAAVPFSSNTGLMPVLELAISDFTTGADANFTLTKINGVKVILAEAAAASGLTITMMGLRGVTNAWTDSALDFDTRLGALVPPVTSTGLSYAGSVATDFEFIRGDGTKNDPYPSNIAFQIYFFPGGSTSPNDATGSSYNVIGAIFREQKDIADGTGSIMECRLKFNDLSTVCEIQKTLFSGGAGGTRTPETLHQQSVGGPLDPTKHYIFRVEVTGTTVQPKLYHCDVNGTLGDLFWTGNSVSTSDFAYINGRVGFKAELISRDSYLLDFQAVPTGYAVLETVPFISITPVDGVRLRANYAQDENLFTGFSGSDLTFDGTKTISGNGAWEASRKIQTNDFLVDDWNHTYLEMDMWVGAAASSTQPQILLNGDSLLPVRFDKMGPNQWNHIFIDLARFNWQLSGVFFHFTIGPDPNAVTNLGTFWIDNMTIGRRRVAWAARAKTTNLWREFRGAVNDPKSALHFNPDERGNELQVQATALTPDAWLAVGGGIKVWPHYAELGNPVYDSSANV